MIIIHILVYLHKAHIQYRDVFIWTVFKDVDPWGAIWEEIEIDNECKIRYGATVTRGKVG